MNPVRVVIPSWSPLSEAMRVETGQDYPAYIQVRGTPLYRHIARAYQDCGCAGDIRMVLAEHAPALEPHHDDGVGITAVRLHRSASIGQTVLAALQGLASDEALIVHMADTLVGAANLAELDVVHVQPRSDLYRWTSLSLQSDGSLRVVNDRDENVAMGERQVCVGVFAFSEGLRFRKALEQSLLQPVAGIDPFFVAIEAYSRQIPMRLGAVAEWYDYGHVDTYHESRLRFQNLRHFNELTYDPQRNIITKKSRHTEAFRHQVRWYRQIPDELAYCLPRIYASSDGQEPSISMEFLSIPTLSELFVGARLEIGAWNGVARKLADILGLMGRYSFRSTLAQTLAQAVYVDKTRRRVAEFLTQSPQARHFWVAHEGQRVDLDFVLDHLDRFAQANALTAVDRLTPIHGDLCFSNILFDPRVRQVKLIDPRGEFGVPGIYGDPRYDLAKLLHSYRGGYDFIVSDRFSALAASDGQLQCSFMSDAAWRQKIINILDEQLFEDPALRQQCLAIQALLFLSMLPLHSDAPQRQLAMLHVGLSQFAQHLQGDAP